MLRTPSALALVVVLVVLAAAAPAVHAGELPSPGEGTLWAIRGGAEPVAVAARKTRVDAEVAGFAATVAVSQTFTNPFPDAIEAVYVFPLPDEAAVSAMTIRGPDWTVRAAIETREEARRRHDAARAAGHVSALLDQERPNVFSQAIASIPPGVTVDVELRYDLPVRYDAGVRELVLPLTVGPRFIPGTPTGAPPDGTGTAPDTDRVPDASRITPPKRSPTRPGQTVDLRIGLAAGARLAAVESPSHELRVQRPGPERAIVSLARRREIPNRDFVLRFRVADAEPAATVLSHRSARGGFVTLWIEPPAAVRAAAPATDTIFVVDSSASMAAASLAAASRVIGGAIDDLGAGDRFALIGVGGGGGLVGATPEQRARARRGLATLPATGSSDLGALIARALSIPGDRARRVLVVSDGLAGNDDEILRAVAANASDRRRVFVLGVGAAANRSLLERVAELGGGTADFLVPGDDERAVARRVRDRLRAPSLDDVEIDWGTLDVSEVAPASIPDVFPGKPLHVTGRFGRGGRGEVVVRARRGARPFELRVPVDLRDADDDHALLERLWARAQVRSLELSQLRSPSSSAAARVRALGLEFGLVTRYTSLVAIGERVITDGDETRTVAIPVDVPAGLDAVRIASEDTFEETIIDGTGAGEIDAAPAAPPTRTMDGVDFDSEAIALHGTTLGVGVGSAWNLGVAVDLGAAFGVDAGGPSLGARLDFERRLPGGLVTGARLRLLSLDAEDARVATALAVPLSTSLLGGAVRVGASAGLGLVDDRLALAAGLGLELRPWRSPVGLNLQLEHWLADGDDLSALTLGVGLRF